MKVSELITKLQELQELQGDLDVVQTEWEWCSLIPIKSVEVIPSREAHSCTAEDCQYPLIALDF